MGIPSVSEGALSSDAYPEPVYHEAIPPQAVPVPCAADRAAALPPVPCPFACLVTRLTAALVRTRNGAARGFGPRPRTPTARHTQKGNGTWTCYILLVRPRRVAS